MNVPKFFSISFLILSLFFSTTSNCQEIKSASSDVSFRPQITQSGLIFGSISFPNEKANYNGYFLIVRCISTDKKSAKKNSREVRFSPKQIFKMQHKGELDNGLTYVFALDLPEGEYEISGIRLFSNSGIAILQRNDLLDGFSVPFSVSKGEIKYVGNIYIDEDSIGNVKSVITYHNKFEKDLGAIKIAQPYVLWKNEINAPLEIVYKN